MNLSYENLKYNGCIFYFGSDNIGEILAINNMLCNKNEIVIVEPSLEAYRKISSFKNSRISSVYFDTDNIDSFLQFMYQKITILNYNNIMLKHSAQYFQKYNREYNKLYCIINEYKNRLTASENNINSFKEINLRNTIYYINSINDGTLIDEYKDINKNVPAIIVSAGPSLDKNLAEMIKHKDKLKNYFIIAGNRTLKPLISNNIKPDLLVTVDPNELTHVMINSSSYDGIPIVYYEKSNHNVIKEYKGEKILQSAYILQKICGYTSSPSVCLAGSVAHTCTDIAAFFGCSPIIFIGQDLGYTFNKKFADNSKFYPYEVYNKSGDDILVDDVSKNKIRTSKLLNIYKKNMESLIRKKKSALSTEFINCSYGADIEGAPHKELETILRDDSLKQTKKILEPGSRIEVNAKEIYDSLLQYMDDFINGCSKYIIKIEGSQLSEKQILELENYMKSMINTKMSYIILDYIICMQIDISKKFFRFTSSEYIAMYNNIRYKNILIRDILLYIRESLRDLKEKIQIYINDASV